MRIGQFSQLRTNLIQRLTTAVNQLVGIADRVQGRLFKTATLQAFNVHAKWRRMVALGHHKRRHILYHNRATAQHHMLTDTAELVDRRHTTDNGKVFHFDVACQRSVIGENTVIADHAVMRDVRIDHQQVIVTHTGDPGILHSAAVNGDAFADHIAIADFGSRRFTVIFLILIGFADRRELINLVIASDTGMAVHHHVGFQYGAFADFYISANHTKRADLHTRTDYCPCFYDRRRMNEGRFMNHGLHLSTCTH